MKTAAQTNQSKEFSKEAALARILKVIADENRLKIISCLASGKKCVCQLTEAIDIPQNLMSHHLRTLKENGLVEDERQGRWIYYSLKTAEIENLAKTLVNSCKCKKSISC